MHCDEKLVLVGKGSEEERIKNFVKEHNLEGRVQVNGAIFGEEMDRIIERAKVVLVPSEWYEMGHLLHYRPWLKGRLLLQVILQVFLKLYKMVKLDIWQNREILIALQ